MRNVVKTVTALPESYTGNVTVVINDKDDDVMVRNVIFLLLTRVENVRIAVDTILHLWYSGCLKASHQMILKMHVRPLVADFVEKISSKQENAYQSKTFELPKGMVKCVLVKRQWLKLLATLDATHNCAKTEQARIDIVMHRQDHLDRHMFRIQHQLHQRMSIIHFKNRGVLLPFGAASEDFTISNP